MSGQSLSQTAYRELIRRILEGELKPGDTLQESRLCTDLGMSRTPVREAIARIRSEGLAEQSGRFLRLRRIGSEEIEEIFFLRRTLEPSAIRAATGRILPEELDGLEDEVRALMRGGPGKDDLQWHVDRTFHGTIAIAAGNPAVAKVIHDLHMRTCIFDHRVVPERFELGCREHLGMIDAMRQGDADAASAQMEAHLSHARDAIFEHLDEVPATASEKAPSE
ncbi:GntR family transcriptional regulator [Allosediminivita pacifica]|uniref:GntR family transcriptional regulator n=1 Tax=Allosediminivita pacifica TaxID=1267769 RepID=A0A2T6ANG8_9RHOB|nr:GntR family transcriptional regulator [Allosediminivita pacifica]PTX45372.1 GntR family transcriptional regulator [Allosediminivita pacifica]GGB20757.1 GntR family transcriptional regulator [Allosediminivita pacifica]